MSELTFQELKKRIAENDNRFTAIPYLLLLQERKEYVAHDEYNWNARTEYVFNENSEFHSENKYELVKELLRYGYSKEIIKDGITEYQMGYYWNTVNVFLTDKGYEDHMKQNGHNIMRGSGHRTFGIHAFRNPEIKKMFEAINRVVELEALLEKQNKIIELLKKASSCDDHCNGGVDDCYCGKTATRKQVEEMER